MTRIVIIGAGGHAQVVADILLQQPSHRTKNQLVGFLDDNPQLIGHDLFGARVLGSLDWLVANKGRYDKVIIGIGNNRVRKSLATRIARWGIDFTSAIHQSAVIGSDVNIGNGTVVCANVVINPGTKIGKHVILNTGATVDHHNKVGHYSHCAPGTHTGGDVMIGDGVFIGIGASVLPRMMIEDWAVVGAGAIVNKRVTKGQTVVGVPAKSIKS